MNNKVKIKVGMCVAYDWYLLEHSIPLIYDHADIICLSLDKDRISWTGNPFSWNEAGFVNLIKILDPLGKIDLYQDDFHIKDLTPMENEVRQRKLIAERMGSGGWHIQLDTDEYFINFGEFVRFLQNLKPQRQLNVVCPWVTLYKQDENGFYYVKPSNIENTEFIQIATMWPHYEYGRRNGYFNIYTDFVILHQSWARSESEIWEKLNNWGHKNDFDLNKYFNQWSQLNLGNYTLYRDFHHLQPALWPALGFIEANTIMNLIQESKKVQLLKLSPIKLRLKNSIWLSRLRSILKK